MACMGTAVIFVKPYLYAVWTWVSYPAISPMNGLGMKLTSDIHNAGGFASQIRRICFSSHVKVL